MIQDATGKFSSRWLLPDRNSLAVVIGTCCCTCRDVAVSCRRALAPVGRHNVCARRPRSHGRADHDRAGPHIEERASKTNAGEAECASIRPPGWTKALLTSSLKLTG